MGLEVVVEDRSGLAAGVSWVAAAAGRALTRLGYSQGELGVAFVGSNEMERLNRQYMGRAGTTDVLSFPLDAEAVRAERMEMPEIAGPGRRMEPETAAGREMEPEAPEPVPQLLGDVIICPQVAAERAGALGASLRRELCLLLVHGILHIAGFDHETDAGEMDARQAELVAEICEAGRA